MSRLSRAAAKYSIQAEVVSSKNCNSGHIIGQTFILDVDGNFITKLCPNKLCVYLISQLTIPVALINERLSEGLEPNDFHFMRYVRCPDTGVDCYGYGEVILVKCPGCSANQRKSDRRKRIIRQMQRTRNNVCLGLLQAHTLSQWFHFDFLFPGYVRFVPAVSSTGQLLQHPLNGGKT